MAHIQRVTRAVTHTTPASSFTVTFNTFSFPLFEFSMKQTTKELHLLTTKLSCGMQVTNRVVEGFYGMDLKYDLAIKLAALQIQQKTVEAAAGRPVKVTVRQAEREFGGLGKFVPSDLLHSMRGKDLRKALEQQIKQNENLASPGEKHMSSLQCKLHYLNLAMELFSYGGRYFDVVLLDNDNDGPCLKKVCSKKILLE